MLVNKYYHHSPPMHEHRVIPIFSFSSVEIAVRSLEDDPTFNAGHGSSLNTAGQIEMDAIIMDGSKTLHDSK